MTPGPLTLAASLLPAWADLRAIPAEIALSAGIVAVLLAACGTNRSNLVAGGVALASVLLALLLTLVARPPSSPAVFHHLLHVDHLAVAWRTLLLLTATGVIVMWFGPVAHKTRDGDGPEFFVQLLGGTVGLLLMGSTSNLMMLFIALEFASLPSYVLAGFRKGDAKSAEAGLKYVLFGAAAAAVTAYGLSLVYGVTGTLDLANVSAISSTPLLIFASICVAVGVAFKIAAVPVHFWTPDVFEGSTPDVAAFLSIASKGAGIVLLLRLLHFVPGGGVVIAVAVVGAITATLGNVAALRQENLKRLLAYSSIAQAGYLVCGAAVSELQATLIYLALYVLMNLAAFTVAAAVWRATGGERVDDLNDLGRRSPILAASMALAMVSLIGVPPLAGFFGKFILAQAIAQHGALGWILASVIVINSVVSLFYYGRVLRAMYLTKSSLPHLRAMPAATTLAATCAGLLVVSIVFFNPLARLAAAFARID